MVRGGGAHVGWQVGHVLVSMWLRWHHMGERASGSAGLLLGCVVLQGMMSGLLAEEGGSPLVVVLRGLMRALLCAAVTYRCLSLKGVRLVPGYVDCSDGGKGVALL